MAGGDINKFGGKRKREERSGVGAVQTQKERDNEYQSKTG